MNLSDDPDAARFRRDLSAWLVDNLPTEPEPATMPERYQFTLAWQRRLYAGGYGALSWPTEYGGAGRGPMEEAILADELGAAKAPTVSSLSYLGRPLLEFGSEEQRRRYLPGFLSFEELWCQGFSEPNAGSDLASLRCRAVERDGSYIISGQKIWTSYGTYADYCLALVRTSNEGRKHEGITAMIVPMSAPGVTVRPIKMANGDEEFAEVFFDDVVVPLDAVLGGLGGGWRVAQSTLSYERGAIDIGYQAKFASYLAELTDAIVTSGDAIDERTRRSIASSAVALEVLRCHCLRSLGVRASGEQQGARTSVDKLLMTLVEQELLSTSLEVLGPRAHLEPSPWFGRYVYARAGSIYGGSAQIQRNIIATRLLGLPRSDR
ncbi:MAG: acyl-CoA dehydrogenase family protein [Acidimicrobiia bacterium]